MNPQMVVLDEPTSQLDPISARVFWEMVVRVHEEMGISFVIVEHDSEYIYEKADKVIWLSDANALSSCASYDDYEALVKGAAEKYADVVNGFLSTSDSSTPYALYSAANAY